MNASGLMAVSTAESVSAGAGAQSVRPVAPASRTQITSGKNSFSDTFDALQKKEPQGKMGARDTAAAKTQHVEASTATDRAPAQDAQDVTKEALTKAEPGQKPAPAQKNVQSAAQDAASAPDAALSAAVAAVLANEAPETTALTEEELNAGLDKALTDILERFEITGAPKSEAVLPKEVQSLLRRIPEEGLKNFNLLRTLSGEPLAQMSGAESAVQAETITQPQLAALSAQLRNAVIVDILQTSENLPAVAEDNKELLVQVTMDGLIENTERQLDGIGQVPAGTALQSAAQENVLNRTLQNVVQGVPMTEEAAETLVPSAQPVQNAPRAAQLVGDALTVEERGEAASPLDVLAQRTMRRETMGQGAQQQEEQKGEQSAEQQLPFARTETGAQPAARSAEPAPQPIGIHTGTPAPQVDAPTAPAQEAAPQRPQPDYEIPRQIVEQARLLRTLSDTQMVIRLKPAHLGELTLRVAVSSDGAVQASFHSDNAQVRSVIENSLVQLRQELNNQGLKVDRVGVYTGLADGQMPQGQGQEAWQQNDGSRGNTTRVYGRGDAADYEDGAEGILPAHSAAEPGGVMTADTVDYRV